MVEPSAVHRLGGKRPRRRLALRQRLLRFLRQHEVAQTAGRIGQRRSHRMQAVKPQGAARGFRRARPVEALEVVTRPIVLRSVMERLALRAWAGTILARRMLSLAALALAGSLLAVIGMAMLPRRSARAAARAWRASATTMSIGMGRFHQWRV